MTQEQLSHELARFDNRGIQPGLERIAAVARVLGNPQDRFPAILITGTNGKGSVSAFLEQTLRSSGLKTGLYTSPHLVNYTERIRLGGRDISPLSMWELLQAVSSASAQARVKLTQFEILTLISFLALARTRVDMGIVEVGLGGRWDATNLLGRVEATVITNIDLDHTEWLGTTREQIAREKSGIIRPRVPLVTAAQNQALAVIEKVSRRRESPLFRHNHEFKARSLGTHWPTKIQTLAFQMGLEKTEKFKINLLGPHQIQNAAVVLALLNLLQRAGYPLSSSFTIKKALSGTNWPGRFEILLARLKGQPVTFLMDGAHNPAGIKGLSKALTLSPWGRKPITILFGCMKDKSARDMIRILAAHAGQVLAVPMNLNRSLSSSQLVRLWKPWTAHIHCFDSLERAVSKLPQLHKSKSPVLVTGSLYLVGQLKKLLPPHKG